MDVAVCLFGGGRLVELVRGGRLVGVWLALNGALAVCFGGGGCVGRGCGGVGRWWNGGVGEWRRLVVARGPPCFRVVVGLALAVGCSHEMTGGASVVGGGAAVWVAAVISDSRQGRQKRSAQRSPMGTD